MTSYTNIFGGNNINTAFPSYNSYTLTGNITMNWATSFVDNANTVALINDFSANANTYIVTLPDARLVSTGQDIRFNNVGANNITFNANDGTFLFTLQPTQIFDIYLSNNTTQGGTWRITQFGAGTAQAQAINLVGANSGLTVLNGVINSNMPNKTVAANYQLVAGDRANLLIFTGGTATFTMPTLANVGNGYYVAVNNQGGGNLTINTGDGTTIDGNATLTIKPGGSCIIDGGYGAGGSGNWNTLGLGQQSLFAYSALSLNVAGNSNVVLTNQQAANQFITFTGLLTGNITVTFPTTTSTWYVYNNTTGNFTITAVLNGNNIVVPQSEKLILYSDGTNFYNTPTVATSVVFNDGSNANPSIAFASDLASGFYKVGAGSWGYSSSGTQALTLGSYGLGVVSGGAVRFYNAGNTHYAALQGGNTAANVTWTLPLVDATSANQLLFSNAAGTLAFTTATYPTSTTINQLLYSSANNVIGGLATANNATLITSAGGVPSLSQTLPTAVQGNITSLGTITSGVWNGTPVTVQYGGTGLATLTTAYGVVCAGTTATGALQNAGTGTANQILVSNGNASLPTWQNITTNILPNAVKADQTTATSTNVYVNPAVQQYHPSAVKFWAYFNGNTVGTNPPIVGYNVASVQRISAGQYQINFTTPFTTANYVVNSSVGLFGGNFAGSIINAIASNNCQISTFNLNTLAYSDPAIVMVTGYGTQ